MAFHQPVSGRVGSRGRTFHHADDWYDGESVARTTINEEYPDYHRAHIYPRLLTNRSRGIIGRLGINQLGIVAAEEPLGTVENWIGVHIHRQEEQVAPLVSQELAEALQELREAAADAEEDGLEVPSEVAIANAERLLKAMYRISPRRFVVYPVSGGRIAIDARGPNDRIAVLTCDSDGGALCLVTIDGESRRARYSTARRLPDGFIREALTALDVDPAP